MSFLVLWKWFLIVFKIKLPDLKIFISTKKNISPWDKFYSWLIPFLPHNTRLGRLINDDNIWGLPKGTNIDVTKIGLCEEDYNRISKYTLRWAKNIRLKGCSEKTILTEVGFLELNIGPRTWFKDNRDSSLETGYIYVEKDYLTKG